MSLPTKDEAIAFVLFFFPGFLTLWLLLELSGTHIKDRTDLEKIILSSIFSVFSFLATGVSLQTESISQAVFDISKISSVFLVSVGLAICLTIIIKVWKYLIDVTSLRIQSFWSHSGRSYTSSETCCSYILRHLFNSKNKTEIIIFANSGEVYKGILEGYNTDPLEIILTSSKKPILELKNGKWKEFDGYLLYLNETDIKRISLASYVED